MFQLAQVNIARARAPLTDTVMADFMAALDRVNAYADRAPGFVWRYQDESGAAIQTHSFDDPLIIVNLSVWASVDALKTFVYRGEHLEPLRRRAEWFTRLSRPHMAMWWVPAGHLPSVSEARDRLDHLSAYGESAIAFTFHRVHERPTDPLRADVEALMRGHVSDATRYGDLDGRTFVPRQRAATGDATMETRFTYRRQGPAVWATYSGGGVRHGMLAARENRGMLVSRYLHAAPDGVVKLGTCVSSIEEMPEGRLRLREHWRWDGRRESHWSVLDEL